MNEDTLVALTAEIERQNAALEDAKRLLTDLDDDARDVPRSLLDELDEATTPRGDVHALPIYGVRA
ncbi:MAG: hypothetical protein KIS78_01795 [Labilithrix sp.]|nr:hypothetical protein [Labilithrix sp.]MCW5831174.1 hypothetical protein [Labilithrix sp.]